MADVIVYWNRMDWEKFLLGSGEEMQKNFGHVKFEMAT